MATEGLGNMFTRLGTISSHFNKSLLTDTAIFVANISKAIGIVKGKTRANQFTRGKGEKPSAFCKDVFKATTNWVDSGTDR